MPKTSSPSFVSKRMANIHALGHPNSPAPRTAWTHRGRRSGETPVPAVVGTPFIPNTPGAPVLTHGSGADLIVTWVVPPIDVSHSLATGFTLRYSLAGAATWTIVPNAVSPRTLTGLPAATAFDVQILASNPFGGSAWSASGTLMTGVVGPNAPNVPAIASVAPPPDGTAGKLKVVWTAPAVDAGHDAATGYNLRYSPSGANTWTVVTGATSPYTLTGLSGGATIDVEVQATNAAASPGAWSAATSGTAWGATVAQGGWVPAATQVHGTATAPNGGAQMFAVAAPTAVTGASFAWSASNTIVPTSGLIAAGPDGQANGWGQWFNTPALAGTYYVWMLAQGSGGATIGALPGAAITVT